MRLLIAALFLFTPLVHAQSIVTTASTPSPTSPDTDGYYRSYVSVLDNQGSPTPITQWASVATSPLPTVSALTGDVLSSWLVNQGVAVTTITTTVTQEGGLVQTIVGPSPTSSPTSSSHNNQKLAIGLAVSLGGSALLLVFFGTLWIQRRRQRERESFAKRTTALRAMAQTEV